MRSSLCTLFSSVEAARVPCGARRAPRGAEGAAPRLGSPGRGNAAGLVRSTVPPQPVAWACLCRQAQGLIIAEVNILTESLTDLTQTPAVELSSRISNSNIFSQ